MNSILKQIAAAVLILLCTTAAETYGAYRNSGAGEKEIRVPVSSQHVTSVEIKGVSGELTVDVYSGNDIIIRAKGEIYEAMRKPERAEGLEYIGSPADNTGIGLNVTESEKAVIISARPELKLWDTSLPASEEYTITVPERMTIRINAGPFHKAGPVKVKNAKRELEIKAIFSDVILENVTGPAIINTVRGNIEGEFSVLDQESPSSLSTVTGHIDLTLPAATGAGLDISTMSGKAFTDFDFEPQWEDTGLKHIGGGTIKGKINEGGVRLIMKTVSGNIYLRKK